MSQLWILGVVLVVVGSIGNNLGNNLVSLGHKHHNHKKKEQEHDHMVENQQVSNTTPFNEHEK